MNYDKLGVVVLDKILIYRISDQFKNEFLKLEFSFKTFENPFGWILTFHY